MEKILTTNMHSAWRERCLKVSQLKQRDIPASKAFLWPLYPKEQTGTNHLRVAGETS